MDEVLAGLPDALDRKTTAERAEELLVQNVAAAFTVAMIWGHGFSGYGPYRTAWILTGSKKPRTAQASDSVIGRLSESVRTAREQGAVEGFRYLNTSPGKIAGLGPAFFTKWLFFVTAQGDICSTSAAPVLDKLVIDWLRGNTGVALRRAQTADYDQYVTLLQEWGAPYDLSPASVEERIFRLIRQDGQDGATPNGVKNA